MVIIMSPGRCYFVCLLVENVCSMLFSFPTPLTPLTPLILLLLGIAENVQVSTNPYSRP